VNVLAAALLIRMYLPGMAVRGWGRAIQIASDSALAIPEEMIHYGVSKTALLALSRGFAKDAAGTGVTVNSVIAGPTHTAPKSPTWSRIWRHHFRRRRREALRVDGGYVDSIVP
jgi:NAD(P)-dependent dehydrogenase (short-subunit alcohol dehydrogenase family)